MSCPAARFCEAVGSYDVGTFGLVSLAEAWNGRRWTIQHFPAPTGSTLAGLTQVSCTSARFCESVGFYENLVNERLAFAARWNGTTWRLQHMPNPTNAQFSEIGSLSCVSARFCEASGGTDAPSPLVEQWNGQSWRLQHVLMDVGPLSCVSATFCAGTGAVWNGSSWSAQTIPRPAGATSVIDAAVSCVSSAFCEAVGRYQTSSGSTVGLAATWNGTSWALQPIPSRASAAFTSLNAVSCASTTACEAGGDFILIDTFTATTAPVAMAEAWNGSTWSLQHRVAPPGAASNVLSGVSCVSAVFCEAVGSHPDRSGAATVALAEVWTGVRWKIQRTPDPATASNGTRMSLTGVSCVSRRFCEAVGFSSGPGGGGAEKWNGTAWKLQAIPGGNLTSVSCTSVTFCMAAGADGHVDTWNGTSWSAQASATGFTSLKSVSCASRRSCEAVGFGPSGDEAEGWNGSTWSPQATPTPAGGSSVDLLAVSCAGTTSCEAVGWYFNSTFEQVTLAELWNGTAWKPQRIPSPATSPGSIALLDAVRCAAADACAAVGHFTPFFSDLALVEVWNGKQWRLRTASSFPYAAQNDLNGVSCATSQACTAVGVTNDIGGVGATLIETGN